MKSVFRFLAFVVAAYFIVRAVVEPFVVDFSDPSSYENDWGGPSLIGVLAVHMVPGIIAAALLTFWLVKTKRTKQADD
ncbi:PEP-CTERM protein-sorting domain-containing protein [Stackebrandtia soli]